MSKCDLSRDELSYFDGGSASLTTIAGVTVVEGGVCKVGSNQDQSGKASIGGLSVLGPCCRKVSMPARVERGIGRQRRHSGSSEVEHRKQRGACRLTFGLRNRWRINSVADTSEQRLKLRFSFVGDGIGCNSGFADRFVLVREPATIYPRGCHHDDGDRAQSDSPSPPESSAPAARHRLDFAQFDHVHGARLPRYPSGGTLSGSVIRWGA